MSQRFQSLPQYLCNENAPGNSLMSPLVIDNDPKILAEVAAAHVPALSDDMYHLIRAVVPPPPLSSAGTQFSNGNCNGLNGTGSENLTSDLFTRRPTEESLLLKVNRLSSCAKEAKTNLEELYIQLIEPKKYTDEDVIELLICQIKEQWPTETNIQEQALKCLVHISQHSKDFCLSHATASSVLNTMRVFQNHEIIQRFAVRLLANHKLTNHMRSKIDLAFIIFNSICKIPGVDDFMLYAKNLVSELDYSGRALLRSQKPFIEMMLSFPCRKNDQITVYLCWCALDTLTLLAECNQRWDVLIDCDGEAKLQGLSLRPELEDRCKMLLERVFSTSSEKTSASNPCFNNRVAAKPAEYHKVRCSQVSRSTDVVAKIVNDAMPVDELPTRKPPTPPPILADFEGQFSDDETYTPSSPFLPYCSPSPSYSPPPETNAILLKEMKELMSPASITENGPCSFWSNKENITSKTAMRTTTDSPSQHQMRNKQKSKLSPNRNASSEPLCIFCKEPKGRQTLLVKQLKQISHCLQQPCNVLLFKCLEANLCESHRI